jgi:hypothetical protein
MKNESGSGLRALHVLLAAASTASADLEMEMDSCMSGGRGVS